MVSTFCVFVVSILTDCRPIKGGWKQHISSPKLTRKLLWMPWPGPCFWLNLASKSFPPVQKEIPDSSHNNHNNHTLDEQDQAALRAFVAVSGRILRH